MWDNRMKIRQEDYNTLMNMINKAIDETTIGEVKKFRKTVKFKKCQFTSFVWAMFRFSTTAVFRQELYEYLQDRHVESALKSILEAYKEVK